MNMKNLISLMLLVFIFGACSDAPSNYPGALETPVTNDPNLTGGVPQSQAIPKHIVESPDFFKKPDAFGGDEGSPEEQKLKEANLNKPIIYGVGAAGITMDTTYAESKKLLTKPLRGPMPDGGTLYNEQIYVIWKSEGERKPALIVPLTGYLGKIDAGKFGVISLLHKFLSYKADKEKGAARLTRDLYNEFEKVTDPKVDCFKLGRCRMLWGTENQANFVIVMPGIVFLLAKEEFQLAELRIIRDIDPGILSNDLDLLQGKFLIPDSNSISLGTSNKQLFSTFEANSVKTNPEIYVQTNSIGYSWNGVWVGFDRTNFSNTVTKSEDSDVAKVIQVGTEYTGFPLIEGKRVLIKQTSTNIELSLASVSTEESVDRDPQIPSTQRVNIRRGADLEESELNMSAIILKENAKIFVEQFANLLSQELKKKYANVYVQISGDKNPVKTLNEISASVIGFDQNSTGVEIGFQVSQEQQKINFITVQSIGEGTYQFDRFILESLKADIVKKEIDVPETTLTGAPIFDENGQPKLKKQKADYYTELAGLKLNDLVKVTQADTLGRNEANISLLESNSEVVKNISWDKNKNKKESDRVEYVEQGAILIPEDNRPVPRTQGMVKVGSQVVAIGLKPLPNASGADKDTQLARVVSIESSRFTNLNSLCGLNNLVLTQNMFDVDVEKALSQAISTEKIQNPKYSCDHFTVVDSGAKGALRQIYFPKDRLVLNFSNRALATVTIYLPLNEVNATLPEVR